MKKYILFLLLLCSNLWIVNATWKESISYENTYKNYNFNIVNSKIRYEKLLHDWVNMVVSYKNRLWYYPIFKNWHIIVSDNDLVWYQNYFVTWKNIWFSYSVSSDGKFFQLDKIWLFETDKPISVPYYKSSDDLIFGWLNGYKYSWGKLFTMEKKSDWTDWIVKSNLKKVYYWGGGWYSSSPTIIDDSIAIITEDWVFRLKSDNKFYSWSVYEWDKSPYWTWYALFSSWSKKVYEMNWTTLGTVISRSSIDYIYWRGIYTTMDANTYATEYSFSWTNYAKRVSDSKLLNHSDFSVFWEYKILDLVKPVVIRQSDSKIFETNGNDAFFKVCKSWCDYDASLLWDNSALSNAVNAINNTELKKIKIFTWSYTLSSTLNIDSDNASIEWLWTWTTSIFWAYGRDVFKWIDGSDNWTLKNMTVDSRYNGAQAVYAAWKVSWMVIDNIQAIWSNISNSFVIYFAWPNHVTWVPYTHPSSAWALYSWSTGSLTENNSITNSEIDFNLNSDAVVFAFSSGAIIKNNNIKWKLAYYLSQNGIVENNNFHSSAWESIAVSTPVENLTVRNNGFSSIGWSAVLVKPQVEHDMNPSNYGSWITFSWNTINTVGGFGIAFSNSAPLAVNTKFENISIIWNTITDTHDSWIYVLCRNADDDYCNNINTSYNTITNPNSINQGWYWDSWITFEDRYKDNNLIQGLRNVSFIGNTITDNRWSPYMGFGIRFEYPWLELPTMSWNTISWFKHWDKNF